MQNSDLVSLTILIVVSTYVQQFIEDINATDDFLNKNILYIQVLTYTTIIKIYFTKL